MLCDAVASSTTRSCCLAIFAPRTGLLLPAYRECKELSNHRQLDRTVELFHTIGCTEDAGSRIYRALLLSRPVRVYQVRCGFAEYVTTLPHYFDVDAIMKRVLRIFRQTRITNNAIPVLMSLLFLVHVQLVQVVRA